MQELGYESCKADPDLWWMPVTWSHDKFEYYSYILCYMDDVVCIHNDPDDVLNKLNCFVLLKYCLVGSSDMYLGTKLKHMQLHNGIWMLSLPRGSENFQGICH